MFEKEAEEYRESKRHKSFRADVGTVQINYESYLNNLQSAYKDGAEFGYNKANEWHFVKDGDLPKENKKYWILTSNREPKVDSWLTISWVNSYDVIAWKEIVLPKEIE